ncbi:MAG: tetratricopeptide (TPR) repeat protein [Chitinophagales bacterium]|jgi:tetratricopeptide (TPR) repeat protein
MNRIKYFLLVFCVLQFTLGHAQKRGKKSKDGKNKVVVEVSNASKIKAERLFFDGQRAKLIGDLEGAYENFNDAVKLHPQLDAAYYELAQLQQLGDDFVSAQKNMDKALAISPSNVWYQRYQGDLLALQFKYDEAAEIYNNLKSEHPKEYDYYFQEAYYLILTDQLKEAIEVYDEIEEAIGVQGDASLQKHKIYSRLNKPDDAVKELNKLIEAYPDDLQYRNELADFYLINGQTEKAVNTFEEILEVDPNNVYALTSLADYYKTTGESAKALEYSERAFANPEIPIDAKISVLYNYIKYYNERKDQMDEAFGLADILIGAHPKEAKAYAIAGDLRNLASQPEEALVYYYQSLEQQKDIFTVWQQIFFINSDLQEYGELVKYTNLAKEYFPNQALVYFFNGLGFQQLNEFADAEKSYSRGVKMAGDNAELKAQFYSNLGNTYNDLKKYAESDESFDKALELNPRNAFVLNNYSYYLSLRGENLKKAEEMSLLSNEIQPNSSSFLDTYAWVLYKSEKYVEAKEWQIKAIEASDSPSATLLEHLGDILYKLGDKKAAISKWEEAAELKGGSDKLIKKIDGQTLYE